MIVDRGSYGVPIQYSSAFIDNLVEYCKKLKENPDTMIEVVDGIDSFCSLGCNRQNKSCETSSKESKIHLMNDFGLEIGDIFPIMEF